MFLGSFGSQKGAKNAILVQGGLFKEKLWLDQKIFF